jgi:hypothetical protein
MAYAIARMAKQKGGTVGSSSLHNNRQRETPNADPSREQDNRELIGAGRSAPEMVRAVIEAHGGKPRSDSVEAVEVLLTASPEWFRDDDDLIDQKKVDQFSERSVKFLQQRKHGGICVKATLHMDEHTPHIHGIMVPIDPNGKLNCKHYFGQRKDLRAWQTAFAKEMKPLGLERGREGSRATHMRVQEFYKSIERDPSYKIDYEKLPDPPRVRLTKDAADRYKQELVKELLRQIEEPLRTQLHQGLLARDTNNKLKETKQRLRASKEETTRAWTTLYEEQYKTQQLEHELLKTQTEKQTLAERCQRAEAKVQDVPMHDVMTQLGYRGVSAQQRGFTHFVNEARNQVVTLGHGCAYDSQGQLIARNSVNLVEQVMKREGREVTREQAFSWLVDRWGEEKAKGAYLSEREQAAEEMVVKQRQERTQSRAMANRTETLVRPGPERVQEHARNDRLGHDRGSSGPSR